MKKTTVKSSCIIIIIIIFFFVNTSFRYLHQMLHKYQKNIMLLFKVKLENENDETAYMYIILART